MGRLAILLSIAVILLASGCSDDTGSGATGTPLASTTPDTPTTTAAEGSATAVTGPHENGSAPIFWRTSDNFASVFAGQPYLVNFRIDNGFDEPSLTVTATCTDCSAEDQSFVGTNSPPVGGDAPGSYYPMNLTFPVAGSWKIAVHAGPDEVTIPVQVQPAP